MDQRKSTGLVISCSAGVSTEHYSYDSWILESYLKLIEVQLNFYVYARAFMDCLYFTYARKVYVRTH